MGVRQQAFHSRIHPTGPVRAFPQRPNRAVHEQLDCREDLLKMHSAAIAIARLKHHGTRIVVRERYQRPEVKDLGTKWKLSYWDYSLRPRSRRSKVWAKSKVFSEKEAQRRADEFMAKVNARNNEPQLFPSLDETLASLIAKCREKTWPHLKKSTIKQYEMFMTTYLLPEFGKTKLRKMNTINLQDFFNTFTDRLSPKTNSADACVFARAAEPGHRVGDDR
jgi:hypothetical protein